jgi:hypothetical protein
MDKIGDWTLTDNPLKTKTRSLTASSGKNAVYHPSRAPRSNLQTALQFNYRETWVRQRQSTHACILQTCRQLHHEAKPLMPPNISLHFNKTEAMVNCLAMVSAADIQKISNVRLKGIPLSFDISRTDWYHTTYGIASTLPMFPGLKLDHLTIEDSSREEDVNGWFDYYSNYFDIGSLIESDGWKELHFILPTRGFMPSWNSYSSASVTQPLGWDKLLKNRDGEQLARRSKCILPMS